MGGDLQVESVINEGSEFFFSVDIKKSSIANADLIFSDDIKDKKLNILIVGDNEKAGSALKEVDTIDKLKSLYDEVFSNSKSNLVIMPTSQSVVNMTKYTDMGFKYSLHKPVIHQSVKVVFEKIYHKKTELELSADKEKASVNKTRNIKILLAEDQIINRKIVIGLLGKQKWDIVEAKNGLEAYEKAKEQDFDVILMDVQMPKMDGYHSTQKIREYESVTGKKTPIIAMTAHAMVGDKEKCLAAGMDYYLTKPVNAPSLIKLIKECTK